MSLDSAPTRRLSRALDSLWYVASAPQAFVLLATLLAVTLAFAAFFPQLPAGLDNAATDRWLATTLSRYGNAGVVLRSIRAFEAVNSQWVLALAGALGANVALRLARQITRLRPGTGAPLPTLPPVHAPAGFVHLETPWAAAIEQAEVVLNAHYPRVQRAQDTNRCELIADRRRWAALGPLLGYLGALLLLLGLLVDGISGWRSIEIPVALDSTVSPQQAAGLKIALQDSGATSGEAGGADVARLGITRGSVLREMTLSAQRPGRWGNLWFVERATGPALEVKAHDAAGRPLSLQALSPGGDAGSSLRLRFRQSEGEQAFALPDRSLVFRVVSYSALPDRGINRPVFFIEGFRMSDQSPVVTQLLEDNGTINADNVVLTLRRDRYIILNAAALPGLPLMALGGLAMLSAGVLAFWLAPARTWLQLTARNDSVAASILSAGPDPAGVSTASILEGLASLPVKAPEPPDAA